MPKIQLHKYQRLALTSDKRIVAMVAGLQSGKTTAGSLWTRLMISAHKHPDDTFIVAFPTYAIYNSSTLPAFMRLCSQLGTLNKTDHIFTCKHGPQVFFRSMDNPWSAEGITNCRAIWIDEGGLINTQAFINLMGRAAPREAPIFISTTPYQLNNYLYRDLYEPWKKGERDDVDIIQFRSVDNPYFPPEEYERQRKLLDTRMFAMRYEGQFERMAGLVYQDFDGGNYCNPFKINTGEFHIVGGIDWGYTDPFALVVRAIAKYTGEYANVPVYPPTADYQIAEYKRSGHTPDEQLSIAQQFKRNYGITRFYADSADPGMIELFNRGGLNVIGCTNKSIDYGISQHQVLVRSNSYKVFRGKCPETELEYESYQYKDFGLDNVERAVPLDVNNHLMDANRYVTVMTQSIRSDAADKFKPAPTHLDRLLSGEYSQVSAEYDEW